MLTALRFFNFSSARRLAIYFASVGCVCQLPNLQTLIVSVHIMSYKETSL